MHNDSGSPQQNSFDTLTTPAQANTDPVLPAVVAGIQEENEENIYYFDKITEGFFNPEPTVEIKLTARPEKNPETESLGEISSVYKGRLSEDCNLFIGIRTCETNEAFYTYTETFHVKIVHEQGMWIGLPNKEMSGHLLVTNKMGPCEETLTIEYDGKLLNLIPCGRGVMTFTTNNNPESHQTKMSSCYNGLAMTEPCDIEITTYPIITKIIRYSLTKPPVNKEEIHTALTLHILLQDKWMLQSRQQGIFRCTFTSAIPLLMLLKGRYELYYPDDSSMLMNGKYTPTAEETGNIQLHNGNELTIGCSIKKSLPSQQLEIEESGIFQSGRLRKGVFLAKKGENIIGCYEGEINNIGLFVDPEGVYCYYDKASMTLSAAYRIGCGTALNNRFYAIEVKNGQLNAISEIIGKTNFNILSESQITQHGLQAFFFHLVVAQPTGIKQVSWQLRLNEAGVVRCVKPNASSMVSLDATQQKIWDQISKLINIMQVSQTDLPSSYQLTTKATPVLPSKTSLEESERLRKELEDEEDKKAQKPGKKSKKIDTSATTSQKSASVADPKPHPKPSKKKKVLNFKDDGPLIVAEDKLDDVILPSPTTPHRSLSLFPAISVAPRAIAEELLPEISLQPGEIKVPSRGPTPLPEKWCDLCPPNLLAW